jgi:hypothetical protein
MPDEDCGDLADGRVRTDRHHISGHDLTRFHGVTSNAQGTSASSIGELRSLSVDLRQFLRLGGVATSGTTEGKLGCSLLPVGDAQILLRDEIRRIRFALNAARPSCRGLR